MIKSTEKKIPPNIVAAEKIILGHILSRSDCIPVIFDKLPLDAFYDDCNKIIYKTSYSLYTKNKPINFITLSDELLGLNLWESVGANETLFQLSNQEINFEDLENYITLILEKYLRRNLIAASSKIHKISYDPSYSVESLIENTQKVFSFLSESKTKTGLLPTSEVLLEVFIQLEKKTKQGGFYGISSGFPDLDFLTGGFQKGDLIIIAGRPSMGKTALALNFAKNISETQSFPIVIFSLEMSRQQIIYRFVATESQVPSNKLKSTKINSNEWFAINKSISYLANLRIYLDDNITLSLSDMKSKLLKLKSKTGRIGAIVIDYLQLLTETSYRETRSQELSKITRNLKIIAKELDVPVIVLSQLSRNLEARQNKRPLLSDLRESGCLSGRNKLYLINEDAFLPLNSVHFGQKSSLILSKTIHSFCLVPNYYKKIILTGYKSFFKIRMFGKYQISLTSKHKILTTKGWIKIKYLSKTDHIAVFDKFNFSKNILKKLYKTIFNNNIFSSIEFIKYQYDNLAYDLWFPYTRNFICNNIFVHNSIEQDADLVLMLYRTEYYSQSKKKTNLSELIIAKQRNGPTASIKLIFDPQIVTFSNLMKNL